MRTRISFIAIVTVIFISGCYLVIMRNRQQSEQPRQTSPTENDMETGAEREAEGDEGPDSPELAQKWRRLSLVDERGKIPAEAWTKANQQRNVNLSFARLNAIGSAGVDPASWTSRGPQNCGGRTRSLVVNPANPNVLWAGSVGGGVWKSVDAGAHWTPASDFIANLAVVSLIIDPNNPNILYAGTGEGFYNGDAIQGAGIFKTTDGGASWLQLANSSGFTSVNRLAISTINTNIILAATGGGIRRSTDGGVNWTEVRSAQNSFDVEFDPNNGNLAVAHVLDYDFILNTWFHSAIFSTNAGASWQTATTGLTRVNGFFSRIELAYAKATPGLVYASANDLSGAGRIWRSTDGGVNFTSMTVAAIGGGQFWYDDALWVSPVDSNFLIWGEIVVRKSTDGGVTQTQITNGYILTENPHPDNHWIVADPGFNGTTNKRVYVTNDGGIFRTDDITSANTTAGWVSLNNSYQTGQYYGASGNGTTGLIYGGLQDNGSLRLLPANPTAALTFGGDGGFAAVDPTNDNYMYGEYVALQIHRSTNRGVSANYITSGLGDAGTNAAFIAPFILDPNEPNRMLAGGRSLWRSNDVKTGNPPNWTAIRPAGTAVLSAIAVATGNSNLIWIAQEDGKIYKTVNGLDASPTWTVVDDNVATNPLPNRFPTRIFLDPANANNVIVSFGGFSDGNLQRSVNGGTSFSDITGSGATGIPLVPIRGIARNPVNANWLYAGTEVGLFTSENNGANWSTSNQGPANVSVDEVNFMSNSTTLLLATHGRGVWTAATIANRTPFDFDGDRKTDISLFRPSDGGWYLLNSSNNSFYGVGFGLSTDRIAPADFDGDGKTDIAVYRPAAGTWYFLGTTLGFYSANFGISEDLPVPADFDGDGRADVAVFRPSAGTWYIQRSTAGFTAIAFGATGDVPATGDYDGDGKADLAVFRPSTGGWYLLRSTLGFTGVQFGDNSDKPVVGDFDGDGKADVAVFRPANGVWYYLQSSLGFGAQYFGLNGDISAAGDYDGDGKTDVAVFRPSTGTWYLQQSTSGFRGQQFGVAGDRPAPSAFVP